MTADKSALKGVAVKVKHLADEWVVKKAER